MSSGEIDRSFSHRFHFVYLWTFFLVSISVIHNGYSQAPRCCERVTESCATACKQISLITLARNELDSSNSQLQSLNIHCPSTLTSFWNCVNETVTAVREGGSWEGRSCCPLAQSQLCQVACITGGETADIQSGCRRSDEPALYHCLQRQHELEMCCGQSNRPDCVATCHALLREPSANNGPPAATRRRLISVCERESSVISCVINITQASNTPFSNPQKFLPCCAAGRNNECQDACKKALQSRTWNEKFIMDTLVQSDCGHFRLDDKMWGCFLQNVEPRGTASPSKIHRLGMDAPKLHCCQRAKGETCRRLCYNTYSREWTGSWADLDSVCLSSPDQSALRSCVDELDEPCELGCDGLSFCSAFNDRPSDLFRRCTSAADDAAQEQFHKWMSIGSIPLSTTHHLPLKNDSACDKEKWKIVACALELKPCHPKTHATQICRSDCVSLLHECLDFDQFLSSGGEEVSSICNLLSPPQGRPCISLSTYTTPRKRSSTTQVTRPCQGRPCNGSEVCEVLRRPCVGGRCRSFTCSAGCRLGEVSKVVVETGAWVRVPVGSPGCHRLCRCSAEGQVGQCIQSTCEAPSPCWLRRNRIDHGSTFMIDCNLCSCRSSEIVCTKHNCHSNEVTRTGETKLPCNCSPTPSPICGSNGKTYFSNCIARCSGLTDAEITTGDCSLKDPCDGVFCGNGHRCISFHRVCLNPFARRCQQYHCLPYKCPTKDVVCDTEGRQHENLCAMANSGGIFGHKGPCRSDGCSHVGVVCGVDGHTYSSECVAEGRDIPKDYNGSCRFLGTVEETFEFSSCHSYVDCPPLPTHCTGVIPPGACCPICAGVLRLIYSPSQVLRLAQLTDTQLVTVEDMGKKLSALIQTAECRLGIYLGHGTELVVIIRPRWTPWTKTQLFACVSETHRLAALVTQQSPLMEVDGVLNILTGASSYDIKNGGNDSHYKFKFLSYILIAFFVALL